MSLPDGAFGLKQRHTWLLTSKICEVIFTFDSNQAQGIKDYNDLLQNAETQISLTLISGKFSLLPKLIKQLETAGHPLSCAIDFIDNIG